MGKQFRKFKRRMWIGAILRAIFFGVFIGALSLAAQWVYAKQTWVVIDSMHTALYTAVPAVVGAIVVLLILMPRDKRLAAKIDRRLGLDEKVQTMIALRRDSSDMAQLQRESAETAMASAKHRRVRSYLSWIFFALPLVGALAIYGALIMPIRALPTPAPEPPETIVYWQFDAFTEQKLRTLIEDVKKSDMEEEPRNAAVGELEGLIIRLRPVNLESVMQEQVLRTATNIHTAVADYNTYDVVAAAMLKSSSDAVRGLGSSIRTLKPILINEQLRNIGASLTPDAETAASSEGKADVAAQIAEELRISVTRSGLPETDSLNAALLTLAAALEGVTDETDERAVETLVAEAEDSLDRTLAVPLENEVVERETLDRLMKIFGMTLPEGFIEEIAYDPLQKDEYKPDDDQDDASGLGGIGSGDVHYGSDDEIYDDFTGEYTTYGEVLARYYATVIGQMEEGVLPADLEDMLSMYFERLYGANQD